MVVGWAGLPLPAPACRLPACGLGSIPLLFPFLARFVVCGSGDWAREGATGARPEGPKTGTAAVPSGTRDVVFPSPGFGGSGLPRGGVAVEPLWFWGWAVVVLETRQDALTTQWYVCGTSACPRRLDRRESGARPRRLDRRECGREGGRCLGQPRRLDRRESGSLGSAGRRGHPERDPSGPGQTGRGGPRRAPRPAPDWR